jgi:hypothetical protein
MAKLPVKINIQASAKDRKTLQEVLQKIAGEVYLAQSTGSYGGSQAKKEQAHSGQARMDERSYRWRLSERKDEPSAEVKK